MSESSTIERNLRAALGTSCPLIAMETPDPGATVARIADLFPPKTPIIVWDISSGFRATTAVGSEALAKCLGDINPADMTSPSEAFAKIVGLPENSVVFAYNLHNLITDPTGNSVAVNQALWNLRDQFKAKSCTLIGLGIEFKLPAELLQDFIVFDEPLPGDKERAAIIEEQLANARAEFQTFEEPDERTRQAAIDATRGMSAFMVEQQTAISLVSRKLDVNQLRQRARRIIEQTQGLSIGTSMPREAMGGNDNLLGYLATLIRNGDFGGLLHMDEIEKMWGGIGGDLSGVTQELFGTFLTWMQDKRVGGIVMLGPAGTGKSAASKVAAHLGGWDPMMLNISDLKGSLVGESSRNLRVALKQIDSICGRPPLIVGSCNSVAVLPPELRRRFKYGMFFVDLPDAESSYTSRSEREAIWKIYLPQYEGSNKELPNDQGWTGAEIENCVEIANTLRVPLTKAAEYIVPVSVSAGDKITALREQAKGRYISASHSGIYGMTPAVVQTARPGARKFSNSKIQ